MLRHQLCLYPSRPPGVIPKLCAVLSGRKKTQLFPFSGSVAGRRGQKPLMVENGLFKLKFCEINNIYLTLCIHIRCRFMKLMYILYLYI